MSDRPRRKALLSMPALAALAALAAIVVACSNAGGGASPLPSGASSIEPSAAPTASPDIDAIEHPTGATDVVLRYEETGGFLMATHAAALVPLFTLYGDGTIVFRDPTDALPPMEGSVGKANPLRTAMLTEEQVQDLLRYALGEGGLAVARPEYRNDMVADASTAVFTVGAGGLTKIVSVYALGMVVDGLADAPARATFAELAETLTSIEDGGVISATDYVPTAYRGVLFEGAGMVDPNAIAWPWDDIAPADFAPDVDPNGLPFPHRTMTPAEAEALGVTDYEGGLQNVTIRAEDGSTYSFALRPLLPDETE